MIIEKICTERFSMDFFRFGKGKKTMVILPGLSIKSVMDSSDMIADAYGQFGEEYTVYIFDRRSDVPSKYTVNDMAKDTAEAFRALKLENICLFGASQGGMIALVIAEEYPELVAKMVLGSSSARVRGRRCRVMDEWIRLAKAGDKLRLYLSFGKNVYPPAIFDQYKNALTAAAENVTDADLERFVIMAEGTKDFDASEELDKISCPVFAISSSDDRVLGPDALKEISEKLKNRSGFRIYMYDKYGHAAYDLAPDYKEKIMSFFGS